jgi:hypothetical protein
MTWYCSSSVTRIAIARRTFVGEPASDGLFYFDLPAWVGSAQAASVGLALSGPPPPPAVPFDKDAIMAELIARMEVRFAQLFPTP